MNSLQRIFDAAWQAFIIDNKPPALNENGDCRYLTNDGRKCAVGLCIPDGHPAQQCNGQFHSLLKQYPFLFEDLKRPYNFATDMYFSSFQLALHDDLIKYGTSGWFYTLMERVDRYLSVAKDYNLKIPEYDIIVHNIYSNEELEGLYGGSFSYTTT